MKKTFYQTLRGRIAVATSAVLAGSALLPMFLGGSASALVLTNRSLSLDKNTASTTGVTYSFSAKVPTGGSTTLGSIEVDLCDSPFLGTACAAPTGLAFSGSTLANPNPSAGTPTLGGAATGSTPNANLGTGSTAARIRVSWATPQTVTAGTTVVSFDITGVTNPSSSGTFYARIGFFSDNAYTTFTDSGAMAQSVQATQNVSFKIQETLAFCVGAMANGTVAYTPATFAAASLTNDCGQTAGTNIALGIAPDSTTACITPASAHTATCADGSTSNDDNYGYAMLSTNASFGATIGYRADTSGSYTQGTLSTAGQSCGGFAAANRDDYCINPVNLDQSVSNGTVAALVTTSSNEEFGMATPAVNQNNATTALALDSTSTGYGFTGNATGGTACSTTGTSSAMDCWNWNRTGSDTLATATGPVDNEGLQIFFASKASITSPSGQYAVNVDYFSVPTY